MTVCYVLYYELLGPTKRSLAGFLMGTSYSIGIVIVAFMGYVISGWRHFTLCTALLGIPLAIGLIFLPESPRWLVTKKKYEQADAIITKIVVGNGKKYKDAYRQSPPAQSLSDDVDELNLYEEPKHLAIMDVLRNKKTAVMLASTICSWFICGLGYYVLTFASAFGRFVPTVVKKNDLTCLFWALRAGGGREEGKERALNA